MNIVVRTATENDFEGVGKVFIQELKFHTELLPELFQMVDPIMTPAWYSEILSDPEKALFVADRGEEIIGVLLIKLATGPDDPIYRPRRYAYLEEIAVAEKYRGRGVGRLLMESATGWASSAGVNTIELHVWELNKRAISFYGRLGYETFRRRMRRTLD